MLGMRPQVLARSILSSKQHRSFRVVTMHTTTMAPNFPRSGPIHWILDWDGTITKRDTLDALVNIAAKSKPSFPVLQEWKRVSVAYVLDYEETLKLLVPDGKLPSTVPDEKTLLARLEEVEQRSIDRVSSSGIFKDLTTTDLNRGAKQAIESENVQLQDGCQDFFQHFNSKNRRQHVLNILSVNWSQTFIAACLEAALVDENELQDGIHANELDGINQDQPSSGRICPGRDRMIISSRNKLACLENMRRYDSQTGTQIPVVYVGDSWTDFECLLAADFGICIRDDPIKGTQKKLADSLERIGIRCPHIHDADAAEKRHVVWAKNFEEIEAWMHRDK